MRASLTVYIDPKKRDSTASALQRAIASNLAFFPDSYRYLGWVGQSEIEVKDQKEAFMVERDLQNISGIADLEIITDSTAEEEELNLRYVQLNETIHTGKLDYPNADWYHEAIRIREALQYAKSSFEMGVGQFDSEKSQCKIGLVDTGYSNHPETKGFDITGGKNFISGENQNDPLDTLESTRPFPIYWGGHGTSCAGVMIGRQAVIPPEHRLPKENTYFDDLVNGLLPFNLKVAPFRVSRNIISFTSRMAEAFFAISELGNIPIISVSHASLINRKIYYAATREAYERGIIIVAAPGSHVFSSKKVFTYPAKYEETIAPAASTREGIPWLQTHGGKEVDLCAPGFEVYIPWPFKNKSGDLGYVYKWSEGSSFAVPIVATAAALWRMHHGTALEAFSPIEQVELFRSIIKHTASPFKKPTDRSLYGTGILNIEALLKYPLKSLKSVNSRKEIMPETLFTTKKMEASLLRELEYLKAKQFIFNQSKSVPENDFFIHYGTSQFQDWFRKNNATKSFFFKEFLQ